MTKFRTHYDNLKVTRDAPLSVIKAAYKALCQNYHPDKFDGGSEQAHRAIKIINEAHAVLTDPAKRAKHDKWIAKKEQEALLASEAKSRHSPKAENDFYGWPEAVDSLQAERSRKSPHTTSRRLIDRRYFNHGDGTITDMNTGLQWMRCCLGQTWNGTTCVGDATRYRWQEMSIACKTFNQSGGFFGYRDWRIPNMEELKSLAEQNKKAINSIAFPAAPLDRYWSSTQPTEKPGHAYFVSFHYGRESSSDTNNDYFVRLVRNNFSTNKENEFQTWQTRREYTNDADNRNGTTRRKHQGNHRPSQASGDFYWVPDHDDKKHAKTTKGFLFRLAGHIFDYLFFYLFIMLILWIFGVDFSKEIGRFFLTLG